MLQPTVDIVASPIALLVVSDEEMAGLRLRRDRAFTRIRSGVYAEAALWNPLRPWERYLARVHAYALRHPDAVFSHESAAALRGWPIFGEPRDIHVFDVRRTRSLRFGDVMVHTSADPRGVDESEGFAITSVMDTVVDLARVLPPAFGLAVVDAALRDASPVVTVADLRTLSRGQVSRRGRLRLEWLWENADERSESTGESVSRAVIAWSGFEPPELQVVHHHEGFTDRTDFRWRAARVIGEFDGLSKYDDEDPSAVSQKLLDEKRREDRLRRHEGIVVRWHWKDAMTVTPLRDMLVLAGVPRITPPSHALLTTLRKNPRSLPPRPPIEKQHPGRETR